MFPSHGKKILTFLPFRVSIFTCRIFANVFFAAALSLTPGLKPPAHTQATLILAADTAKPGDTVLAGVHLRMDPEWHTYWTNSGDSGIATSITWDLPAGITAGEIQWPVPKKLPPDDLTTYVYENEVVLLVPLKLAPNLAPGPHEIKAKVGWLECREVCIANGADVRATLNVGTETKPSTNAALIETWRNKLPGPGLAAQSLVGKTAARKCAPVDYRVDSDGPNWRGMNNSISTRWT